MNPDWTLGDVAYSISGASKYTVANNIKQPKVDEWNIAWEQQFLKQFKFTVTGIARDWHNFVNSVLPGAQWATPTYHTTPRTLPPWAWSFRCRPGPDRGEPGDGHDHAVLPVDQS